MCFSVSGLFFSILFVKFLHFCCMWLLFIHICCCVLLHWMISTIFVSILLMDIWFLHNLGLLPNKATMIIVGHMCVLVYMSTCFLLGVSGRGIMTIFTSALSAYREGWLSPASIGSLFSVLSLYPLGCLWAPTGATSPFWVLWELDRVLKLVCCAWIPLWGREVGYVSGIQ